MNVQVFIFNWRRQYEKTKEKERQFAEQLPGVKVTVINSDEEHEEEGWVNLGEKAYFSELMSKAVELFDGDVMWHIQADASYDDWSKILDAAKEAFKKYNWGVFAPNVDYTWYDSSRTDINDMRFEDSKLKFVACTDCTCWMMHKDIISDYKSSNVDMRKYPIGWGWDIIFPSFSILRGRPVIRDYSQTVHHPRSSNYDHTNAENEMQQLYNSLPENLRFLFYVLKAERSLVPQIFAKFTDQNIAIQPKESDKSVFRYNTF